MNVFVLITGYFMIDGKFKIKKVINLVLQVFTYTFIFLIINCLLNNQVSLQQIIKSILPVMYSHYWFITTYIILYILSPYINKFVKSINKEELGVIFNESDAVFYKTLRDDNAKDFKDIWLFRKDLEIKDLSYTDGEVIDSKWVTIDEFEKMINNKEIIPTIDFAKEDYKKCLELE